MPTVGKTVPRSQTSKNPGSQISEPVTRRSQRITRPSAQAKTDSDQFLRPLTRSVPRAKPLYKSSSCHNIKSSRSNSNSSLDSCDSSKESRPRKANASRKPGSTVALPIAVLRESNSSTPGVSNSVNGDRIYVNSDLLSRVEKEKKQYEARISELIQLTESRKTEIERLTSEVKNLREAKKQAEFLIERHNLKCKAGDVELGIESSCPSCQRPLLGGAPAVVAATSTTSDHQSVASGASSLFTTEEPVKPPSVTNLENRIHEMEEVNYSTTEELQATMGELCEMQRALDEIQEENRNLAFERAILLESLCTQTAKLEHSRLQIEQLKYLLVTNPAADSRESHYVELYTSVEAEKQILLTQNNDLAQRCESLDAECRQLSEKVESKTAEMEQLKATMVVPTPDEITAVKLDAISVTELSSQVEHLVRQVAVWKEKYECEAAEHEREVTDLKLHERHLLKTVQVADEIRAESEAEVARCALETHELRAKVQRISADLETAVREKSHLQDQLSKVPPPPPSEEDSSSQPLSVQFASSSPPVSPLPLPSSSSEVETRSTGTMTLTCEATATTNSSVLSTANTLPPTAITAVTAPTASSTPTAFQHPSQLPRSSYMQKLGLGSSVSPGGPVGGNTSGIGSARRSGPTVQSLIQSIENQVKAVHQQKNKASIVSRNAAVAKVKMVDVDKASCKSKSDLCSMSPPPLPRRLHSAGNSPIATPTRSTSAGRHPLIDDALVGDSAPGGPPHTPTSPNSTPAPSVPSNTAASSAQPANSQSTTPISLMRSKTHFGVTRDDTPPSASKEAISPHVACSTTPRLKRNLTIPASSTSPVIAVGKPNSPGSNVSGNVNGNTTLSEAVSTVISTAAGESTGSNVTSTIVPPSSDTPTTPGAASGGNSEPAVDPLQELAKRTNAGSKRNALLRWCQMRVAGYRGVEVTNFSSSWNDGMALCALLHTFLPQKIGLNWERVADKMDKRRRFEVAFAAAESQGIPTTLCLSDMLTKDRPDWNRVMAYIASIYKHFEAPPALGAAPP
ncbi:hypothetical protein Aperf_G00000085916 [Anoplocephala perfoliata]